MSDTPTQEGKSAHALREEATLAFWKENQIFEKSLETPAGAPPKGDFVFYDGPPFATGEPHYGHILAGTLKDVLPRYKAMLGFRVPRRWGWDCHGLPIENLIEKELGLKTKKDIEEYGIEKFNAAARASVLRYAESWRVTVPRSGRWVDMENDYRTMDSSYTESIWWAFKTLYEKELVSEGYKAMHLCPRCETTLANFEVNQGYKDITDISVFVKFELLDEPETYLLAWTTTPWTLPGNVALAVNPDFVYTKIKLAEGGAQLILAKERLATIEAVYEVMGEMTGSELVGKKYRPLFDYYTKVELKNFEGKVADMSGAWKVYGAPFVTSEDGTGVVHIAPAFGDDDMQLAREYGLPFIQHVGTNGAMQPEVTDFAGKQAKPKDDHMATDVLVIKYLAAKGVLFAKKKIVHSYPHCWRCDTPLLNYASTSWFVKVTSIKDALVANNKKTEWIPETIRDGRFGKWLEGARDWAISRSRFWGAPLPVWRCSECKNTRVLGSVAELSGGVPPMSLFVMRHGEGEHNIHNVADSGKETVRLTEHGRDQARTSAAGYVGRGIDLIIASPLTRTRETAEIAAEVLGLDPSHVVYDDRLREIGFGEFEGRTISEYRSSFANIAERFTKTPKGGENLTQIKRRVGEALYEIAEKYSDKRILVVSHETPLWLLATVASGGGVKEAVRLMEEGEYLDPAQIKELSFSPLPHNHDYELDLHRPYIDGVSFACSCGGKMKRIPEVFDCWFESGSMPFAEPHYPFENKDLFERRFPADFIAEGLDQTRGWFYNLLVLSTALFDRPAFKTVIVNGTILAEDGQKMSKRLKNYPEVSYLFDKYGADALRFFLMTSPSVHAEDVNFTERSVAEVANKVIGRLINVLAFYEQNKDADGTGASKELDEWILARTNELVREVTTGLEAYELDRAARPIALFVDDLSTWYIRRSRKNFSPETTRIVLETFSKVVAPFMPFLAEALWSSVKEGSNSSQSVHLTAWPTLDVDRVSRNVDRPEILEDMKMVRLVVEQLLAERAVLGIKVRQPLGFAKVKISIPENLKSIIQDEVNLKDFVTDESLATDVWLDAAITPELRLEGEYRELTRAVQDLRKEAGLSPKDRIILTLTPESRVLFETFKESFVSAVSADEVRFGDVVAVEKIG